MRRIKLFSAVTKIAAFTAVCLAFASPTVSTAADDLILFPLQPTAGGVVTQSPANFSYAISGGVQPVLMRCTIDNGDWLELEPCPTEFSLASISNGRHTLQLQATDADGNSYFNSTSFFANLADPAIQAPEKETWTATCPAVRLLGVSGSGENGGEGTGRPYATSLGSPVGQFAIELEEHVVEHFGAGAWIAPTKLPYIAAPVGFDIAAGGILQPKNSIEAYLNTGYYKESVDDGEESLKLILGAMLKSDCVSNGKTHIVLAGYSQGAQVIGNVLEKWKSNFKDTHVSQLGTVVFFGDPKFTPGASGVYTKGSFDRSRSGVLGTRDTSALKGFKVLSYCRARDPICQGTSIIDGEAHGKYNGMEARWAANEASWYAPYARGDLAREDVSDIAVSVDRDLNGSASLPRFRCKLNDGRTGYFITGKSTCLMRFSIVTRTSGGGMAATSKTETHAGYLKLDNGLGFISIDTNELINRLPACLFVYDCANRRFTIHARVSAVASAAFHHDSSTPRSSASHVYELVSGRG